MKQFKPIHLLPSVVVALGIIAASLVMRNGIDWPPVSGPIVLGIAIVIACIVDTKLHGDMPGISIFVRVVVGAILIGSALLFLDDPIHLKQMIPILGAVAWVSLLQRPATPRTRD